MIIGASKKYIEAKKVIASEAKAPRKIIVWVIALQAIEMSMVGYLIYKSVVGG